VLKLLDFDKADGVDDTQWLETDLQIVKSWGRASRTLFLIALRKSGGILIVRCADSLIRRRTALETHAYAERLGASNTVEVFLLRFHGRFAKGAHHGYEERSISYASSVSTWWSSTELVM
jgi:hypothetical protein